MAKFCGNCGTKWNNDAKVCGHCGYPLEDVRPISPLQKYRKWVIIGISLLIILFVAATAFRIIRANTGYRGTVKKTIHAFQECDLNTLSSLALMDYYDLYDTENVEDSFEDDVNSRLDELEDAVGGNLRIKYEILNVYPLSDRKLEHIKSSLEEENYDVIDWEKVINLNIRYTVKGSLSTRNYTNDELYLVKEGKQWKIIYGYAGLELFG
jgi:hypothetical protein